MNHSRFFLACAMTALQIVGLADEAKAQTPTTQAAPSLTIPVPSPNSPKPTMWNLKELSLPPQTYPAEGFEELEKKEGLRALFYDGLPYKGKPTRVFAWYGVPRHAPKDKKLSAMVLVHGGGGTAFADWVKLWNSRGYAAIAMDTCGQVPLPANPEKKNSGWKRHEASGPSGWGGFDQLDWPVHNQWSYHAVADVILAHSLIRSFPEVDPERIGVTGISWGGYLTCIVAGVDSRFKFAAPVYGCGFLYYDSNPHWLARLHKMGPDKSRKWMTQWDPSQYLPFAGMPMLWVTGSNDFAFPLSSLQKSYQLAPGDRRVCVRIRMTHAHGGPGENPSEILTFAESIVGQGVPLLKCEEQGLLPSAQGEERRSQAWVRYSSPLPVTRAVLAYTQDEGVWVKRLWNTEKARLDDVKKRVEADIPAGTKAYYFMLYDNRDQLVTSEHVVMDSRQASSSK